MLDEIMKSRSWFHIFLGLFFAATCFSHVYGQSFCNAAGDATADNSSLPWKFRPETKSGNWANSLKPVMQEMQRVFPQPPKGLEITHGIFDAMGIRKQLIHLKPEQRSIIDLAYFSGYTQDEISKEMGIPLGTVKTRMRAAIIELRKMLQYN